MSGRVLIRAHLRSLSLHFPEKGWVLAQWPPVTPVHHWTGLHAGTLQKEAAQWERMAYQV